MALKPKSLGERFKDALVNPELDKVKAEVKGALKKAKEHPENSQLATSLLERGLAGLDADLAELKIPERERKAYREAYEARFKTATENLELTAVAESLEGQKLDAFINDYAKYAKLDAVIAECKKKDSKEPMKKFMQTIRKASPILAGIGAGLMKWLGLDEKKKKEEPSKLEAKAAEADKVVAKGGKKEKKDEKKKDSNPKPKSYGGGVGSGGGGGGRAPESTSGSHEPAETEVESTGSKTYEYKPEHAKKRLSPAKFKETYQGIKDRTERHRFVLAQVAAGNANNTFEKLKVKGETGMTVEFEVDQTGLRVAGMDVQLDGPSAMAAAMLTGCTLPNKWVVDQAYKAAKAKDGKVDFVSYEQIRARLGIPHSQAYKKVRDRNGKMVDSPNGNLMMSAQFALERDKMLKEATEGKEGLVAGYFKSILLPHKGKEKSVRIYGARYKGSDSAVQPDAHPHYAGYSDYSHQARRVKDTVTITDANGKKKKMKTEEFYASAEYGKEFGFTPRKHGKYKLTPDIQKLMEEYAPGHRKKAPVAVAEGGKTKDDNKKAA